MEDIRQVVRLFILDRFLSGEQPPGFTDDSDLQDEGILDSLSTLKLVSFLEERFHIDFAPEDLGSGQLSSVITIEQAVRQKQDAAHAKQ